MPKVDWEQLNRDIVQCTRCPRLRDHCLSVAQTRRRAYVDQVYSGRPITGFGDRNARIWIVGLAPGAHGANRTGRVFTGDRSGDFLYAALHRAGYANQPTSTAIDDGLKLKDVFISAAARCAPPGNKPLPTELAACAPFLEAEWTLLRKKRVILALGRIAWDAALRLARSNDQFADARVEFGHGAQIVGKQIAMIGSYHVSQQNTFTGRLTEGMFDAILDRAQSFSIGDQERGTRSI